MLLLLYEGHLQVLQYKNLAGEWEPDQEKITLQILNNWPVNVKGKKCDVLRGGRTGSRWNVGESCNQQDVISPRRGWRSTRIKIKY